MVARNPIKFSSQINCPNTSYLSDANRSAYTCIFSPNWCAVIRLNAIPLLSNFTAHHHILSQAIIIKYCRRQFWQIGRHCAMPCVLPAAINYHPIIIFILLCDCCSRSTDIVGWLIFDLARRFVDSLVCFNFFSSSLFSFLGRVCGIICLTLAHFSDIPK